MAHDHLRVDMPSTGIVAVRGHNGAGKSALLEAVSWGVWGTTIRGGERGKDPTQVGGAKCRALVVTDRIVVERTRRRGKAEAVLWRLPAEPDWRPATTATKAQAEIDAVVGGASLWQRTAILSSSDAARFSLATDGERKRLLEGFLGLGAFDTALDTARKALSAAERECTAATRLAELLRSQAPSHDARLQRAQARSAEAAAARPPTDAAPAQADIDRLDAMHAQALKEVRALPRNPPETAAALSARAALEALRQQLARLGAGNCPVCTQPIPASLRDGLEGDARSAQARAEDAAATAAEATAQHNALYDELRDEAEALGAKVQELVARQAQHDAYSKLSAQALLELRDAQEACAKAATALEDAEVRAREAQVNAATLRAVETVLGLRGMRAGVLHRASLGLEAATNAWLARLAGTGVRVSLTDAEAGASGKVPFTIHGMGGGEGYDACSGGERRRVDVALTMALAQVAAASEGAVPGTLGADEVFDALDPDGIDAAMLVLADLARDRAVVVITHTPELAERLRPVAVMRLVAGGGTITNEGG